MLQLELLTNTPGCEVGPVNKQTVGAMYHYCYKYYATYISSKGAYENVFPCHIDCPAAHI
jgi:hypothetical protein